MRKQSKNTIPTLKRKVWAVFSEWVRRSANGVCYTCGSKNDWKKTHAGHYIHGKLDYNPMNIHCQCAGCNTFKHGNLGIYAEKLIAEHGADQVEELRLKSKQIWKPSRKELEDLLDYWTNQLNILKSRGLK